MKGRHLRNCLGQTGHGHAYGGMVLIADRCGWAQPTTGGWTDKTANWACSREWARECSQQAEHFWGFCRASLKFLSNSLKIRTSGTPSSSSMTIVRTQKCDCPWKSRVTLSGDSPSLPVFLFPLTSYLKMSFNKPRFHFTLAHPEILFHGETKDPVSEGEGNSAGCRWQCGTVPLPPTLLTTCDVEPLAFLIYLFPNDDI